MKRAIALRRLGLKIKARSEFYAIVDPGGCGFDEGDLDGMEGIGPFLGTALDTNLSVAADFSIQFHSVEGR